MRARPVVWPPPRRARHPTKMLISIITPCLNRAALIPEAIESVQQQDHPLEHIVLDGGSTDGTLDILGRYPSLKVDSRADDGIYDALNRGLELSRGAVIGFLNTDDRYEPDILGLVGRAFTSNPDIQAVVGGATIFSDGAIAREFPAVPPGLLLERATVGAPVFNAWFFRRDLLLDIGGFDLRYRFVADRDLLIRMAMRGSPYSHLDRALYHYRMHPGSITLSGRESGEAPYMFETRELAQRYLRSGVLTAAQRRLFKEWHSQIVMEQALAAIHAKGFVRSARYLTTGLRHDPRLSVTIAREFARRAPGEMRRLVGR
jgi:GT2 family glycosyltransferase